MAEGITRKTILVADDDPDMRHFIGALLHEMGHQIVFANDGKDALLKISENSFDLIVLDIMMPHLHGLGVLELLKESNSNVPVIMATARQDARSWAASMNMGAKSFLHKPFTAEALVSAVKKALGSS